MGAEVDDDESLTGSWMEGSPRSMEKQLGSCHNISFALLSFRP